MEAPARLGRDRIEVDGRAIAAAQKRYWMMNKPRGVVTTASDEQGRETVYDLLSRAPELRGGTWLAPVGRLDKASEGLLLLTNDSEWAARVLAPETHLKKTYHVQIASVADEPLLKALRTGVQEGGETLRAAGVEILRGGERNSWLGMVLEEGKNRQIRRMLKALGVQVLRLVRVAIGDLALGDLEKGAVRELSSAEKQALDARITKKKQKV
jgi:23S rRNA pseudouridine2605 synthase